MTTDNNYDATADPDGGLQFRKSSFSNGNGGACVEMADLDDGGRALRDSKDPHGPVLRFTASEWAAFAQGMTAGEFG